MRRVAEQKPSNVAHLYLAPEGSWNDKIRTNTRLDLAGGERAMSQSTWVEKLREEQRTRRNEQHTMDVWYAAGKAWPWEYKRRILKLHMEAFRGIPEADGLKLLVAWLQGIHRKPHRAEAAKTALSLVTSVFHVPTVRFFHDANIPSMGENGLVGKFSDPCAGNTRILMTLLKDDPILFLGQLLGHGLWDLKTFMGFHPVCSESRSQSSDNPRILPAWDVVEVRALGDVVVKWSEYMSLAYPENALHLYSYWFKRAQWACPKEIQSSLISRRAQSCLCCSTVSLLAPQHEIIHSCIIGYPFRCSYLRTELFFLLHKSSIRSAVH